MRLGEGRVELQTTVGDVVFCFWFNSGSKSLISQSLIGVK